MNRETSGYAMRNKELADYLGRPLGRRSKEEDDCTRASEEDWI